MARKREQHQLDSLVIGAGPAGILYGLRRHLGSRSTLVIDRSDVLGGQWRSVEHMGALWENGLHFVHQPARWNELLFDLNEECPISQPTQEPLEWDSKKWRHLKNPESLSSSEQPFAQSGLCMIAGGMSAWLRSLAQRHNLPVQLNESLMDLSIDSEIGITNGITHSMDIQAREWIFTGSPWNLRDLFSGGSLKTLPMSGAARPALVLQYLLRRPVTDLQSVLLIHHRMDHQERRFMGLFESNLDPQRAPTDRQTCTWMCFLEPEDFEDPACLMRWKRALVRTIHSIFEPMERGVLWQRFLALPQAGGLVPSLESSASTSAHPELVRWKNAAFLVQQPSSITSPHLWTTRQVVACAQTTGGDELRAF